MLVNNRLSAACYRTQTLASMMAKSLMDYHITESAHSIHLDVVSTVPEGYHPEP